MKTSGIGIAAAAILMAAAGAGFGIAQAMGINANLPVAGIAHQDVLEQGRSPNSFLENRPVLSFDEEEKLPQVAETQSGNMQPGGPIETGNLPARSGSGSPAIEVGGNMYRVGIDTGP